MFYHQFYLIPIIRSGLYRSPKYLKSKITPIGITNWSCMDYGNEDQSLCCVSAKENEHRRLNGNLDVFQFPKNLNENVTSFSLNRIKNQLKIRKMPSQWVLKNKPYKGIVRNIAKLCQSMQLVQKHFKVSLFNETVDFDKKCIYLSTEYKNQLTLMCSKLNILFDSDLSLEKLLTKNMEAIPNKDLNGNKICLSGFEL